MVQLTRDWIKGEYKELSKNTIILIIISLLYLVIPSDMIPDFLPLGFIDDIDVIGFVMKKISDELIKYKKWKEASKEDFIEDEKDNEINRQVKKSYTEL